VQADVSLLVRVTSRLVPGQHQVQALMKPFGMGDNGAEITIIVQAPPGLGPAEPLQQALHVPAAGDSDPIRFAFHPVETGPFRIRVSAFAGGTFLANLVVEVSVEPSARPVEPRTMTAGLGSLAAQPGEVTLQVRLDEGRYSFQLLSSSYLFEPVIAAALTAKPTMFVERTLDSLRAMAGGHSRYSPGNARTWMEETGIGLWNDMVPELIKEQFWQLHSSIASFSIASGNDPIPWELLYPLSRSHEEAGFLVEQFPVLRRAYGQCRSSVLSLGPAFWVVPPDSPVNAEEEVEALQRKLASGITGAVSDLDKLIALINAGTAGLLHFACHNTFAADKGSSIAMRGGPFIPTLLNRAVTTRSLAARSPLVFINACRSAGAAPHYTQLLSFAGHFMAAGAGAFVGTLWDVPSDRACVFAEAFYDALRGATTFGPAMLEARQATATALADPTWLAYTAYGDPAAHVSAH
jgi:hypothetical protein